MWLQKEKEMEEKKTITLKVRITPTEKEKLENFANKYNLTMSEIIRKYINHLEGVE
jgi:antitoxin component of RelBE/YafQ-DinJ toxin-antitoxin module